MRDESSSRRARRCGAAGGTGAAATSGGISPGVLFESATGDEGVGPGYLEAEILPAKLRGAHSL